MNKINTRPSERSIYIWNIAGSMTNAFMSMLILAIVTRILDNQETDIFSIAWSISQLMATIGTFQIRTYQATDVTEKYKFNQYFIFRCVTVFAMIFTSVLYIVGKKYSFYKSAIVLIICLFRAVDSLADVYEGFFSTKRKIGFSRKSIDVQNNRGYALLFRNIDYFSGFVDFKLKFVGCVLCLFFSI